MTAINVLHKVTYYSTPKVACTSIKRAMFEIENGFQFRSFSINGSKRNIHHLFPSVDFLTSSATDTPGQFKFAVVRNPVERLLSAYSNRVQYFKDLSRNVIEISKFAGILAPDPSLSEFIAHFEDYRSVSRSLRHHTEPQTVFLGRDSKYFDRLFRISEIADLERFLSNRTGLSVKIGHEQRSGSRLSRAKMTADEIDFVERFFVDDYSIFGDFF